MSAQKKKAHSNLHTYVVSKHVAVAIGPAAVGKTVGAVVTVVAEAVTRGAACVYVTTGAGSTHSTTGSGFPVFHNRWRSLQDGCRDEHGWQGRGSPISKTLHSFRRCLLVDRCSAQNFKGLGAVDHLGGDRHCYSWEDCWCRCHSGHWSRIVLHNGSKLYLDDVLHELQTVERRRSSPQLAPVDPTRPARQGNRPP